MVQGMVPQAEVILRGLPLDDQRDWRSQKGHFSQVSMTKMLVNGEFQWSQRDLVLKTSYLRPICAKYRRRKVLDKRLRELRRNFCSTEFGTHLKTLFARGSPSAKFGWIDRFEKGIKLMSHVVYGSMIIFLFVSSALMSFTRFHTKLDSDASHLPKITTNVLFTLRPEKSLRLKDKRTQADKNLRS